MKQSTQYKYVITSGWWCGEVEQEQRVRYGSEEIRSVAFFKKWKKSIFDNTSPIQIMVVDSHSPTKPTRDELEGIEFLSITENPGHSTNHTGKYCGYMRSIIMGVTYASLCDVDYWVYVEQDALLQGEGIIEECISQMTKPFMFGSAKGVPQLIQQSFIIIRKDGFEPFLRHLNELDYPDSELPPETKFVLAASPLLRMLPVSLFKGSKNPSAFRKMLRRLVRFLVARFKGYDELPVGYGRARPIKFEDKYLYFQHATEEELAKYEKIKM
ncbi:hypothetical protein CA267_015080 [Alteromonas pelagimontana]|uniref:Glycosyltransferase n=1 Tax=Alteromonas pelagimontana TaxID=1858656 RepID=A0A6M4MFN4_9ALTE|nr:hypothetical protein [Alteromonas pelagimontana]QJR81981.1 hypothetical protein CA267_015080 [Alteromonas pelagimontana]